MQAENTPVSTGPLAGPGQFENRSKKRTTDRTSRGPENEKAIKTQQLITGPVRGPVWFSRFSGTGPVRRVSVGHADGPLEPAGQFGNQLEAMG